MPPHVSIFMPTFDQARFICRAIDSLLAQTMPNWELLIVDDGSSDGTGEVVHSYRQDERIRYFRLGANQGLGAALNYALDRSMAPLIAYLPSDDVYYADHLASLADQLASHPAVILTYSGIRHHYNLTALGPIESFGLQPVQVMHRRTGDRWTERSELVTDDMEKMFWAKLRERGAFVGTGSVTCEWVNHPAQRHKILREPTGGINTYRWRYGVGAPLRFHTTVGNRIDEVEQYRRFRERPDTPPAPDGLKILLVGELAYNPERILALEERGHRLYGLWMSEPYWYNTVGPVPFGHVEDLPRQDWRRAVQLLKPDVIYALLNWQAVPFAHQVLKESPGVPFVWHFKEGPFICIEKGSWHQLVDLYSHSDGLIFPCPEMRQWVETAIPGCTGSAPTLCLDGDLPKQDWFVEICSATLSAQDGEFHTVVPGRPVGLHPNNVAELAEQNIHLHFYGDLIHGQWLEWIEKTKKVAPRHIHLHPQVDPSNWVTEFSRYDAGWLPFFESENHGEIRRANWDDLNLPARISTLVAAGLPLLQRDNSSHIVATQNLVRQLNVGLFFNDMAGLRRQLEDAPRMAALRDDVWLQRRLFTFDYHADRLIQFFRTVIENYGRRTNAMIQLQERQGITPLAEGDQCGTAEA